MSDEILPATLTAKERKRFQECKEDISEGLKKSWKAGEALREVRDDRLYREDFGSFEEFCQGVYSMTRRYANYLIDAVEIREDIKERSPEAAKLLTHERQVRELANVPEGKRVALLKGLAKDDVPITPDAIRQKVESVSGRPSDSKGSSQGTQVPCKETASVSQVDETGCKLTPAALESWPKREAVQSLMTAVSRVKSQFEAVMDDPIFRRKQEITAALQAAHFNLSECKPYAVCIECQGYPEKQPGGACAYCGRNGVMPKFKYAEAKNSKLSETRDKAMRGRP